MSVAFSDIAQLGIGSALVVVFWKLGIRLIDTWAKGDNERTKAIAVGLSDMNRTVVDHAANDAEQHAEVAKGLANLYGKIDGILTERRQTPIEGTPIISGSYTIVEKKS